MRIRLLSKKDEATELHENQLPASHRWEYWHVHVKLNLPWRDTMRSLESVPPILTSFYLLTVTSSAQCYHWAEVLVPVSARDQPCLAITMIYEVLCDAGGWAVCRRSCYQLLGMCEGLMGFGWRGEEWGDPRCLCQPSSTGFMRLQVVQGKVHGSDWFQLYRSALRKSWALKEVKEKHNEKKKKGFCSLFSKKREKFGVDLSASEGGKREMMQDTGYNTSELLVQIHQIIKHWKSTWLFPEHTRKSVFGSPDWSH